MNDCGLMDKLHINAACVCIYICTQSVCVSVLVSVPACLLAKVDLR